MPDNLQKDSFRRSVRTHLCAPMNANVTRLQRQQDESAENKQRWFLSCNPQDDKWQPRRTSQLKSSQTVMCQRRTVNPSPLLPCSKYYPYRGNRRVNNVLYVRSK